MNGIARLAERARRACAYIAVTSSQLLTSMGTCGQSPALSQLAWSEEARSAVVGCLTNKTVWLLGNSVTRHWAFTTEKMLTGAQNGSLAMSKFSTAAEKARCGAGGEWRGRRPDGGGGTWKNASGDCFGTCECSFDHIPAVLGSGARLIFGWIWELAHPSVEDVLVRGVQGKSGPPDIVVYNVGMDEKLCPTCHSGLEHLRDG